MSRRSGGSPLKGLAITVGLIVLFGVGLFMMLIGNLPKITPGCSSNYYGDSSDIPNFSISNGSAAEKYFNQFSPAEQVEMRKNAETIIQVGRSRSLSETDIEIAIGTSIQEVHLHNLNGGDARSHGLFQQQWGMDWGTLEETLEPVHASNAFYDALLKQPNRETRSMRDVAEAVQRPRAGAYDRWAWDDIATQIVTGSPSKSGAINLASAKQDCKPTLSGDFTAFASGFVSTGRYVMGDDYPYASWTIDSTTPTGLARECVDFVTWRINKQSGVTQAPFKFSRIGDAVDWKNKLTARGYVADHTPTIGAVAWFDAGGGIPNVIQARGLGHVAIVSDVSPDKTVVVLEQYNSYQAPYAYNVVTVPAQMPGVMYIHVADIPQLTPAMAISHG